MREAHVRPAGARRYPEEGAILKRGYPMEGGYPRFLADFRLLHQDKAS